MNCTACETELKPVSGPETKFQFDNALWIGFFGGYGMFVDNMEATWPPFPADRILTGADYEAVLCHDCMHALCEANPWMMKLIDPEYGHSHRQDEKDL